MNISDRPVAIVTGGSRGVGAATAKLLASKLRNPEKGIHTSQKNNVIRIKSDNKTIEDLCQIFPSLNFTDKTIDEPAISLNHKVAFCRATILEES
mgnify:CR=1 FL=1